MVDYTLALGTYDPYGFAAPDDRSAIEHAARHLGMRHPEDLRRNPQEVVTLLGPNGLLTSPAERLDAFMRRVPGASVLDAPGRVEPGDTTIPDCNGQ